MPELLQRHNKIVNNYCELSEYTYLIHLKMSKLLFEIIHGCQALEIGISYRDSDFSVEAFQSASNAMRARAGMERAPVRRMMAAR